MRLFKSIFYLLLVFLTSHAKNVYAGCFHLSLDEFSDSEESGIPDLASTQFVKLNGVPVSFTVVPSSIVQKLGSNAVKSSISNGCYAESTLKSGSNLVQFSIANAVSGTYVHSQNIMSMDVPGAAARVIFNFQRIGRGAREQFIGTTSVQLSLQELAPMIFERISVAQKISEEIRRKLQNHEHEGDLSKLQNQLDELANRDFDQLTTEELAAVAGDAYRLEDQLKDLRNSLAGLTAAATAEANSLQIAINDINSKASIQLKQSGIEASDLNDRIDALDLPTIVIPSLADDAAPFDSTNDQFDAYATQTVDRLDKSRIGDSRVEFLEIIYSWTRMQTDLNGLLQQRSDLEPGEFKAFLDGQKKVKNYLARYVDGDLYFTDIAIPADIKRGIEDDLSPVAPKEAAILRDAINGSHSFFSSQYGSLFIEMLRIIRIYTQMYRQLVDLSVQAKALEEIKGKIREIAECIRLEVSVIPVVNQVVSFCEAVTAHQLCLPNGRILSTSEQIVAGIMTVFENQRLSKMVFEAADSAVNMVKFRNFSRAAAEGVEVERILTSAKTIGFKSGKEIRDHAGVVERWGKSFKASNIDESATINHQLATTLGYTNPPYLNGSKVVTFASETSESYARVHSGVAPGRWVMKKSDIQGLSPLQIKEKFALPDVPTHFSEVTVPSGTNMRVGITGPNYGHAGGSTQFEILERIAENCFGLGQRIEGVVP